MVAQPRRDIRKPVSYLRRVEAHRSVQVAIGPRMAKQDVLDKRSSRHVYYGVRQAALAESVMQGWALALASASWHALRRGVSAAVVRALSGGGRRCRGASDIARKRARVCSGRVFRAIELVES